MSQLLLTAAELAVILELLAGPALALDATALHDLAVTPAQIAAARQALLDRGVLVAASQAADAETGVSAEYALLLATALAPERIFILRSESRGQPARQIIYSRGEDLWVRNMVTPAGAHRFAELVSVSGVVDDMLRESSIAAPSTRPAPEATAPLVDVLRKASGLHLLVRGTLPTASALPADALSWITAADGVWVVARTGPAEAAQRTAIVQLRIRLTALLLE
ncbi:MAG: hypothetical protein CVU38_19810 [Chloroflexi bacterium HGW-Chloroflexi-1]|nr:MAG: hypothetical protein CVU38_19810 [Chloroflexi bacterium HGW-Chloroflexi-1]